MKSVSFVSECQRKKSYKSIELNTEYLEQECALAKKLQIQKNLSNKLRTRRRWLETREREKKFHEKKIANIQFEYVDYTEKVSV